MVVAPAVALGVVLAAGLACGADDAVAPAVDSGDVGPRDDGDAGDAAVAPTLAVELGTGVDTFAPLAPGDTLYLERGDQGLQHVYLSVRADVPPGFHEVDVALGTPESPALASAFRLRVPWRAASDGRSEVVGLFVVVAEPEWVLDAPAVVLRASVSSASGAGEAMVRVRIAWP